MITAHTKCHVPTMEMFEPNEEFKKEVLKAILNVKTGKAPGFDEIFVEGLQTMPEKFVKTNSRPYERHADGYGTPSKLGGRLSWF